MTEYFKLIDKKIVMLPAALSIKAENLTEDLRQVLLTNFKAQVAKGFRMNVTPQIAIDLLQNECKEIEIKISALDIEKKYNPLTELQLKEYEGLKNQLDIKTWTCAMTDSRCWLTMQILEQELINAGVDFNRLQDKAETIKYMIKQGLIKTLLYPKLTTIFSYYSEKIIPENGFDSSKEISSKVVDKFDLFVKYVLDFDML